jgi:hypothetical protein
MTQRPDRVWVNTDLPNQLTNATLLLYLSAVFALFSGIVGIVIGIAEALGAFGIANTKRWGYAVAIAGAGFEALVGVIFAFQEVTAFVNFVLAGVLLYLLLHPRSRTAVRSRFS